MSESGSRYCFSISAFLRTISQSMMTVSIVRMRLMRHWAGRRFCECLVFLGRLQSLVDRSPQLRVGGRLRRGGEGGFEISGKISFPQNGQDGVLDFLQFGDDRVGRSQLAGGRGPGEAIILHQPVSPYLEDWAGATPVVRTRTEQTAAYRRNMSLPPVSKVHLLYVSGISGRWWGRQNCRPHVSF